MNEKSEKVLEQYDIGIRRMTRGRGGIILSTDKGYKLFIQCEKADKYYERENRITSLLSKVGYSCTDTYMRNNEGGLISEDEDGRKYILKNWYDAKESSVRDEDDMCRAVVAMAYMHMALRQITPEMLYADNEASQGAGIIYTGNGVYTKDNKNTDNNANYNANIKDSENIKDNDYPNNRNGQDIRDNNYTDSIRNNKNMEDNDYIDNIRNNKNSQNNNISNNIYTEKGIYIGNDLYTADYQYSENNIYTKNNTAKRKQGKPSELAACQKKKETDLRSVYSKHTRELKKAYNYLKQKKSRQLFEQMAYKNIEAFYEEACRACERLMSSTFNERLERAAQSMELSHGSYTYHNVLVDGKDTFVVNFDRYKNECQINDLYQFIRKVLEKYNWESHVFYRLVDEYDRICPLSDEEMELLMVLLSYPEKFWKIINQYINANKSWIPDKNVEKLRKVIDQNSRKRELIDKICCVW